jgi:hypothetical protein
MVSPDRLEHLEPQQDKGGGLMELALIIFVVLIFVFT